MDDNIVKEDELVMTTLSASDVGIVALSGVNIIDFEGPDDPSDPLNWSKLYKWSIVALISLLSLIV